MKHSCINKLFISYIFVLIASFIFTMHLFSVLPCLVEEKKHYLYYSDNILWSVDLLCSNIFSHAAIGQCIRYKTETCLSGKVITLFLYGRR